MKHGELHASKHAGLVYEDGKYRWIKDEHPEFLYEIRIFRLPEEQKKILPEITREDFSKGVKPFISR